MIDTLPRTELVRTITACRSCGSGALDEVLDLGTHAVSDFYEVVPADELRAPLCLVQCGGCGLVQLTHSVSRDRLYKDYWYRSGLNPSMVAALKDVVDDATSRVELNAGDKVMDIGANDGTLLDQYSGDIETLGIEPSGLWSTAYDRGHTMLHGFYPLDRFEMDLSSPKIITSIAMFYDLDDPNAFVKAIAEDLHPEGIWVNQMMDLEGMLAANAFDNICHEHVGYWSLADFQAIVTRHGLRVVDMSRNEVNGGSVRLTMKHGGFKDGIDLDDPLMVHLPNQTGATGFSNRIKRLRDQCLAFLEECRYNGKTVLGYGASTKGNTLLQYYGIDTDLLPAIAERNPDKVGKLTAGSHIPIISEAEMRSRKPDYLLVLPWAQPFLDGFLERERALLAEGTRLVAPLPTFRVIGG